jgi:CO dehydrogenase/acetyl-CoA synthase alpha subunit
MSQISADPQFQLAAAYPANLDRCRRCGNPRKLHGSDGACGIAVAARHGRAELAAVVSGAAAALGVAVWLLVSTTTHDLSSAAAFGLLTVIILMLAGLALGNRLSRRS